MPNGYTAPIYEGKDISFRDFILHCGRGFGFAIEQRDQSGDVPLRTDPVEPQTTYHDTSIENAHALLAHLAEASDDVLAEEAQREYFAQMAGWVEGKERAAAMAERYDRMIREVQAWSVPSELENMKETVLKWLDESRGRDVRLYLDRPAPAETGAERRKRLEKQALDDIAHHERERATHVARVDDRNRYIRLLLESIERHEERDEAFAATNADGNDGTSPA